MELLILFIHFRFLTRFGLQIYKLRTNQQLREQIGNRTVLDSLLRKRTARLLLRLCLPVMEQGLVPGTRPIGRKRICHYSSAESFGTSKIQIR
jgi:hypothetical protein